MVERLRVEFFFAQMACCGEIEQKWPQGVAKKYGHLKIFEVNPGTVIQSQEPLLTLYNFLGKAVRKLSLLIQWPLLVFT